MEKIIKGFTALDWRVETAKIAELARVQHWAYGDSHGLPVDTHVVSCDRGPMMALYNLGVKDQRQGLETTCTVDEFLPRHGFSRILKKNYLRDGDGVLMTRVGVLRPDWQYHFLLIDQIKDGYNKIYKYDFGSQSRLQSKQPFTNVSLFDPVWGGSRGFYAGYRVPRKDAKIKAGVYVIESAFDGYCFDVANGSTSKRANIQLYKKNGTDAQKWRVIPLGDCTYMIQNVKSGLLVDVANGSREHDGNIWQYKNNASDAQRFFIMESATPGYCTIQNYKSGLVCDVANGVPAKRTNIRQWSINDTTAQKWRFVEA